MTRPDVCIECSGTGYVCYLDNRSDSQWPTQKCPDCNGRGTEAVRFDTGTTASDVDDFLNQIANDAMDGRGTE